MTTADEEEVVDETMTDADGGERKRFGTLGMTMELAELPELPPEVLAKVSSYLNSRKAARTVSLACKSMRKSYEDYPIRGHGLAVGLDRLAMLDREWTKRLGRLARTRLFRDMSSYTMAQNFLDSRFFMSLSPAKRDSTMSVFVRKFLG